MYSIHDNVKDRNIGLQLILCFGLLDLCCKQQTENIVSVVYYIIQIPHVEILEDIPDTHRSRAHSFTRMQGKYQ